MAAELRQQNILVRTFAAPHPLADDWLRVTCPASLDELRRLAVAWGIRELGDFAEEPAAALEQPPARASVIATNAPISVGLPTTTEQLGTSGRVATISRHTKETQIELRVNLDGSGQVTAATGLGFFDHMLTALGHHARLDLNVRCVGDLHVDDHHTVEDVALALGTALDRALGERRGVKRFGYAYAPLDEALARCVIDLSGRAAPTVELRLVREMIGSVASENLTHFFQSLAQTLRCAIHLEVLAGANDHHRAEAAFKATALALRQAIQIVHQEIPSTKGVLA
jgi:imidazoleglycerol phosphate dehydratase HisB